NQEWIRRSSTEELRGHTVALLAGKGMSQPEERFLDTVIDLVKDRLTLLPDFWEQASFFFQRPQTYDFSPVLPKWSEEKTLFFTDMLSRLQGFEPWRAEELESFYKLAIQASGLKMGELMLPLRIMLVGGKFGPHVFDIAAVLCKEES